MSNQNSKVYVDGVFGDVRQFPNGGEIYSLSIADVEGFKKFLDNNKGKDGRVRLDVAKQKTNPDRLSVSLNTWEPKGKPKAVDITDSEDNSGLPF